MVAEPGSELERDLLDAMLEAGIPEPEMQYCPVPGRRFRVDFCWPRPDAKLVCEVEGGIYAKSGGRRCRLCGHVPTGSHGRPSGIIRDIAKGNACTLAGWRYIRVTGAMIANGEAVDLVRSCLARPVAMPVRPLPVGWPQEVVDA